MRARLHPDYGFEPRLDEVLDDPVIQAMMARDGVGRAEIECLAIKLQARLAAANENLPRL